MTGLLGIIFLAGCATTRAYEGTLERWHGHSEQEVVEAWGKPTERVALSDGGKSLIYVKRQTKVKLMRDTSSGKAVPFFDCKTSFLLNPEGTVIGYKFEGPNCRK